MRKWIVGIAELLARRYLASQRNEEAREIARAALDIWPSMRAAQAALGIACERLGELQDAARAFRRALALAPQEVDYGLALARVSRRRGRLRQAIAALEAALAIDPSDTEVRGALAEIFRTWGSSTPASNMPRSCCGSVPVIPGT